MPAQIGQLEIDAACSAAGSILGHLTAGGNRTLQALSINIMAGAGSGFFLGPSIVDYWHIAPGRPAGGVCFGVATVGALMVPALLRGIRPWAERNTDNVIGRLASRVVNILAPSNTEPKQAEKKS